MTTILLATLLAGLPEVTIADEHPEGVDLKVSVTDKTERTIATFFGPESHEICFEFHSFDERGRPVVLPSSKRGQSGGSRRVVPIKPGETATGYLPPTLDYVIPPGRYQVEVTFREYGGSVGRPVRSNRIAKTFP
jgi:hypothetical protein